MPADSVIVGFDEREQGRDAVALGLRLARATHRRAEVVAVMPYVRRMMGEQAYSAALEEDAARIRRSVGEQAGEVEIRVAGGVSAARRLHEIAAEEKAAMIVIGSAHRGAVGRAVLGSVGARLLNGASCPIAVAPGGFARGEHFGLGIVGVGFDGSAESRLALETATDLARRLGAKLRLISVAATIVDAGGIAPAADPMSFFKILRGDQEKLLEEAKASLPSDLELETVLEDGNPAAILAAQGVDLDLLVLGSRGYGPVRRTLLGSVAAEVMKSAPCPVLVVPRGAGEATEP